MGARQQLQGHLTSEMAKAPLVGRAQPTDELTITVGLVVDSNALAETAAQISDPQSPTYRQYMNAEQVADVFGASASDYQTLLDWGQSHGLVPVAHKNRFVATFTAPVGSIEEALQIHLNHSLRPDGTQFFGPDSEPSIELAMPVEHIGGLTNYKLPTRAGGSGPGGEYQGADFRNAYAPGVPLTGNGQSIGIFMFDGFFQTDVDAYAVLLSQTFLPIEVVPPNTPTDPKGSEEGSLDIAMALAMAPAAQVVAFFGQGGTEILTKMSDREEIKQFSSSWFWYDGTATDESLMAQLSIQGQSFFQASGDSGPYPSNWSTAGDCRKLPCITIVGGTDLDMTDNGASYGSLETAWGASSGGPIAGVPIPAYQAYIAGSNGASSTLRNAPDVSAQANGGVVIFEGGPTYVAGTSQATPLWAGFMALVNELAVNSLCATIGFANPTLYAIAAEGQEAALFHDVVSGCATNSKGTKYCAGPGYDLVTGLGTPTAGLMEHLLGPKPKISLGGLQQGPDQTIILVEPGGRTEVFPGDEGPPIVLHEEQGQR